MRTNNDRVLLAQEFLTDRDLQLFEWLHDHQVLTSPQVAQALFNSLDTAQQRLLRLYRLDMLERFRFRRVGNEGWQPWHYVLDQLGAEVIAARLGEPAPRRIEVTAQRRRIATSRTLEHLLGVNQFFIDLIAHTRTHPRSRLIRWWSEQQCLAPLRFGTATMFRVRADAHGVYAEDDRQVGFFLEHDRGTEPLNVLVDKAVRYAGLVAAGGPAWPVLFWLPNKAREVNLHRLLNQRRLGVPVATASREGLGVGLSVADAIWLPHDRPDTPLRLVDLVGLGDAADDAVLAELDRRAFRP